MSFIINPYVLAPTAPSLDPTVLGGYDLDLNADNATISGVPEFDLPDSSPSGRHYGQNTVARQPTITGAIYNGHKAVRFAAGKELVPDPTAFGFSAANTMIVVCTKSSANEYIFRGSGGQGGPAFISEFGGVDFEYFFTATAGHERATFAASASGLHVLTLCKTDDTGNYVGYLDGVQVFSNAIHASDDWDPQTLTRIGAFTAGAGLYDGDIVRILHYSQNHAGTAGLDDFHADVLDYYGI